jgi:hypothetical protein
VGSTVGAIVGVGGTPPARKPAIVRATLFRLSAAFAGAMGSFSSTPVGYPWYKTSGFEKFRMRLQLQLPS